jgi:hypothetical protein
MVMSRTPNTILADINEIYVAYVLNGNKWFSQEAKTQFDQRVKQAETNEVADAIGKAEVMASVFLTWAENNNYQSPVKDVWWTARPGSIARAVGVPVNQTKNPTDVLVKFSSGPNNGFLGLSAKATRGKSDIGFKNPGVGTVDKALGLKLSQELKDFTEDLVKMLKLPAATDARKRYIRANSGIKKHTEEAGKAFMSDARDTLLQRLKELSQNDLKNYLLTDWMDADLLYPPYIKVTGMGSKPPYTASVTDPLNNEKLKALRTKNIVLSSIGGESIGVKAGDKQIMKMRFKFESEKMASSLKMTGDPW